MTMTYNELAATFPDGQVPPTNANAKLIKLSEAEIRRLNAKAIDDKALANIGNDLASSQRAQCIEELFSKPAPESLNDLIQKVAALEHIAGTVQDLTSTVSGLSRQVETLLDIGSRICTCEQQACVNQDLTEKLSQISGLASSTADGLNNLVDSYGKLKLACQNMAKKVDPDATPDPTYEEDFLTDANA